MTNVEKNAVFIVISCLVTVVCGGYKCHDPNTTLPSTGGYTVSVEEGEECCRAEEANASLRVIHFHCRTRCCGERDHQYCCAEDSTSNQLPAVIGGTVCGVLVFGGLVALLVWLCRRSCRPEGECSDHKKLLKEVYAAGALDELFVPSQPLVSVPGTIIHPLTNVSGSFVTMDAPSYVMPDLDQPQPPPQIPPPAKNNNDNIIDENEENWDQWDGFPAAQDNGGVSSGADSSGRGRDNPYYERYDQYAQPPPGYEEVTENAVAEEQPEEN